VVGRYRRTVYIPDLPIPASTLRPWNGQRARQWQNWASERFSFALNVSRCRDRRPPIGSEFRPRRVFRFILRTSICQVGQAFLKIGPIGRGKHARGYRRQTRPKTEAIIKRRSRSFVFGTVPTSIYRNNVFTYERQQLSFRTKRARTLFCRRRRRVLKRHYNVNVYNLAWKRFFLLLLFETRRFLCFDVVWAVAGAEREGRRVILFTVGGVDGVDQ